MNTVRTTTAYRMAVAGFSLVAIVAVYRLVAPISPTTVAFTLLLYILVLAARWGLRYAILASIAASACFNFFFLPPVGTFTIAETQNWVALFAFLGTALIASHLSNRIQSEAQQAKARERELAMLFELSRSLLQTDKVTELLESIPDCISSATQAPDVVLFVDRGAQTFHTQSVTPDQLEVLNLAGSMQLNGVLTPTTKDWTNLPVRSGIRPRGVLLIRGISASTETCESLARLVSIGIDRAEALEEAARSEAAKESERLRMILLDSITHELRTPLTAIKASATTLLSSGEISAEDQHEMLTVIDEEADRLNALIAQAVQMGQLEASGMRMELSPRALPELIEHAIESIAYSLAEHHLQISIQENCPAVLADDSWMERTISNLLRNAAKYSPKRSTIQVMVQHANQQVTISVSDQGPGVDPDEREMIFERFYRGQRFRSRVSGTGLGLAICRAVVKAHRGTIDVQNQPGGGAIFTVSLPVA